MKCFSISRWWKNGPASFAANRGAPTFTRGIYLHPGHFYDFASEGYLVVSLVTQGNDFAQGIADALTFLP